MEDVTLEVAELKAQVVLIRDLSNRALNNLDTNKAAIERLAIKQTNIEKELIVIRGSLITKEEFEVILENSFNRRVVSAMYKIVIGGLIAAASVGVTWFMGGFKP